MRCFEWVCNGSFASVTLHIALNNIQQATHIRKSQSKNDQALQEQNHLGNIPSFEPKILVRNQRFLFDNNSKVGDDTQCSESLGYLGNLVYYGLGIGHEYWLKRVCGRG